MSFKTLSILMIVAIASVATARETDMISFYFHKESLFGLNSVSKVAPQQYGQYELTDKPANATRRAAGDFIYVDETGIYLKKNKLLNISREEIRENSKYSIRNNYIFGVIENDSLPVALDGEMYYFLVPSKTYLMKNPAGANRMMQISRNRYALFSYEDNGYYSVIVVDFSNGGMELRDIVLTAKGTKSVGQIEKKESSDENADGIKTYILSPNKEEWVSFIFSECLETYDAYTRISE